LTNKEAHMAGILDELPSWLLSRSAARAHQLLSQGLGAGGSTGYEFRVMAAVSALGETSQAEIGRRVALDRRDVTDTVRRLEARGLITRRPDPKNARVMLAQLTPHGRSEFGRLVEVMEGIQNEVVAPLSDDEAKQLVALLSKITGAP
jgi:DNA-binding MarR family transcriptional regulator